MDSSGLGGGDASKGARVRSSRRVIEQIGEAPAEPLPSLQMRTLRDLGTGESEMGLDIHTISYESRQRARTTT